MANNVYVVDQLATGTPTITVDDDGTGIDWLVFEGVYALPTDIRLGQTTVGGTSTSASGFYFFPDNSGHRLIINGLIENARGSGGQDYIQGSEVGNLLYGDAARTGLGGADTINGMDGNDTIYGGSGNDELSGAADNDLLFGDAGDDSLSGGLGSDTLHGGTGADSLYGGFDGDDWVSYAASDAGVIVTLIMGDTSGPARGGHAAGDRINGVNNLIGSNFSDRLTDSPLSNFYNQNIFRGMGGNDVLTMGGNDDQAFGGSGNDRILGEAGNDILRGDAGADTLRSGSGTDQLYGGTGGDRFVFAFTTDSPRDATRDRIHDFSRGQGDRIDLAMIDANDGTIANNAFTWRGTLGFSGDAGQLRWQMSGANALVMGDVNGDGVSDFSILLMGIGNLRATDFLL